MATPAFLPIPSGSEADCISKIYSLLTLISLAIEIDLIDSPLSAVSPDLTAPRPSRGCHGTEKRKNQCDHN